MKKNRNLAILIVIIGILLIVVGYMLHINNNENILIADESVLDEENEREDIINVVSMTCNKGYEYTLTLHFEDGLLERVQILQTLTTDEEEALKDFKASFEEKHEKFMTAGGYVGSLESTEHGLVMNMDLELAIFNMENVPVFNEVITIRHQQTMAEVLTLFESNGFVCQ